MASASRPTRPLAFSRKAWIFSRTSCTVAAALFLLLDQAAFLVILSIGLVILVKRNDLSAGEISASLFLFAIEVVATPQKVTIKHRGDNGADDSAPSRDDALFNRLFAAFVQHEHGIKLEASEARLCGCS